MVGTIAPLVQEATQRKRIIEPVGVVSAHVLSSLLGGLAVGLAGWSAREGLAAVAPRMTGELVTWGPAVLGAVAVYLLLAVTALPLPLPMRNRQVPMAWRVHLGPARSSWMYGFVLGAGVLTRINSPAFYLAPVALLVGPYPALAVAPMAAFALTRGSVVAGRSLLVRHRQATHPEEVARRGHELRYPMLSLQLVLLTGLVLAGMWAARFPAR